MAKVKTKPEMTVKELAEAIIEVVGEDRIKEDCDDYLLPTKETDIVVDKFGDIEFDLIIEANWGASEGIYLDVYLRDSCQKIKLFTGKTLRDDNSTMRAMYILAAEIRIAW